MRGAHTAEVPALHTALETLALALARHVDELASDEVVGRDLGADFDQVFGAHAELGELALRLDLGARETAALGLGQAVRLTLAGPELERGVAVLFLRQVGDDLEVVELQHGHGDMLPGLREEPRHADLLCNHSGTHPLHSFPIGLSHWFLSGPPLRASQPPSAPASRQSLISTSTPAARSSFMSASTVCGVGSTMSRSRL